MADVAIISLYWAPLPQTMHLALLITPSNLLKPSKRLQSLAFRGINSKRFEEWPNPPFLFEGGLGTRLSNHSVIILLIYKLPLNISNIVVIHRFNSTCGDN